MGAQTGRRETRIEMRINTNASIVHNKRSKDNRKESNTNESTEEMGESSDDQ